MNQSVLVLGRQPALGLAELERLYGAEHVSSPAAGIAVLDLPVRDIDFKRLGGSTRLASLIAEVPSSQWKDVEKELIRQVPNLANDLPEGKIQLGLSAIGIPVTPQKMIASGLTLKKIIRSKTGRSVRLTPNQEPELNTAQVLHNHLTGPTGLELLVIATSDGKTIIARTTDVQDIESYTTRDRGRPKRDAKVGMLPPKLAQIIINLAGNHVSLSGPNTTEPGASKLARLLDPFCGTGVVLQEALLMDYDAYGTDLEPRMVAYSQENLEWLNSGQTNIPGTYRTEVGDATDFTWQQPINAVACETYLGRAFTEIPTAAILQSTIGDCNLIITKFLRNLWEQIPYGTPVCLAVPAWQTAPGRFRHLPLVDELANLGYNRVDLKHVRGEQLLYYREDQIVARELLVLTRK
jgi:tRNA (guanine10-N2)-dimethyltransferase